MFARRDTKNVNAKFIKFVKENKAIAVFILLAAGFFLFSYADAGKVGDIKKRVRNVFAPRPFSLSPAAAKVRGSIFYSPMETTIVSGPVQNGRVESARIEFVLDGWQQIPFEKTNRFEVWLIGFDANWKDASSRVVYDLPPGVKTYTLLARAKNDAGEYDSTPVVRIFATNTSPYFGQIKINGVSYRGDFNRPHYEKISLQNSSLDLPVNVTGWKILTKRFNFSFQIPRAAGLLNPRGADNSDAIVLARGHTVDIFVGKVSPVGANFRENSCVSYLSDSFEGYDAVSGYGSCVGLDSGSYNRFSVECRSFIRGLNACRNPNLLYYQFINEPSCRNFIFENFNYQSCVNRAKGKSDFYSGRWKVYLGRGEEILDDLNDTVYLYDSQGLLVDSYNY